MEQLAYFFVSKLKFAMWTLFDQYPLRFNLINTIETEQSITFRAFVWVRWNLIADYALKAFCIHLNLL